MDIPRSFPSQALPATHPPTPQPRRVLLTAELSPPNLRSFVIVYVFSALWLGIFNRHVTSTEFASATKPAARG